MMKTLKEVLSEYHKICCAPISEELTDVKFIKFEDE